MIGFKNIQEVNGITYYYITNTGDLTIGPKIDTPMELEHFKYCMVVCCNTTLTMTDKFSYVEFFLEPQSTIKFPYNGTDYSLTNQDVEQSLYIPNIVLLVNTCNFLETFLGESEKYEGLKIEEERLLEYKNLDKELINLFAQQNTGRFASLQKYASIIKDSSELSAVVASLSELWSNKSENTSDCSSFSTESLSDFWSNKSENGSNYLFPSQELSDVNPNIEDNQAVPLVGTNEGHSG